MSQEKMIQREIDAIGSELIERLGEGANHEKDFMSPMHHEYCNATMLGRDCDCGLDQLCIDRDRYREALEGMRRMCEDQYSDGDHWVDANWILERIDKALSA